MEYANRVTIRKLKEFFEFEQVTGNEESLTRWIVVPDLNRPGLELAGFNDKSDPKRVTLIGQKEIAYIRTLDDDTLRERFDTITNGYVPCIIMTHGEEVPPLLKEIAIQKNFPILATEQPTYRVMVNIASFLDEQLADFDNVHGVLMSIFGQGILITGKSGIGKSELALDLVSRGHVLVADDRVDCYRIHNKIRGKAPEVLKRYLEIRGVGIIDIVQLYGASAFLSQTNIHYIIQLQHFDGNQPLDRLGTGESYMNLLGVDIPMVTIPVSEGRNLAVIIEAAVRNLLLKEMGYNSSKAFREGVVSDIRTEGGED